MKKSVPITQRAKSSPFKVDLELIQGAATLGMSKVKGDAAAQFKPVSLPATILSTPPIDEDEATSGGTTNDKDKDENNTDNQQVKS